MIEKISISMLGGLSVAADGEPVLDSSAKINKPWQVFCFLSLNRNMPNSPSRLFAAIWPEEASADPGNLLKNTVYALRREFKGVTKSSESPVLFENGGYICNPAIQFELDVEIFEDTCNMAGAAEGDDRMALLSRATELYKGELLPNLDGASWVMPLSLYYKKLYSECVGDLCEILSQRKEYSNLLSVATQASGIDPLEEDYYTYTFRALYALGMYRVIIPTYHKTTRIFTEELGVSINQEIREIYESASERVDTIEQDIMIIKDDLRDITQENRPSNGPLYCTYDVFKYLFQMVARSSERTGNRIIILLLTVRSIEGGAIPSKKLSAAMNQIKTSVLGGLLRRSDTVARYSKTQYIVMLSVDRANGVDAVVNRLQKRCNPFLEPYGVELVTTFTEMEYSR